MCAVIPRLLARGSLRTPVASPAPMVRASASSLAAPSTVSPVNHSWEIRSPCTHQPNGLFAPRNPDQPFAGSMPPASAARPIHGRQPPTGSAQRLSQRRLLGDFRSSEAHWPTVCALDATCDSASRRRCCSRSYPLWAKFVIKVAAIRAAPIMIGALQYYPGRGALSGEYFS